MARIIKIKNSQSFDDIYCGQEIKSGEYYQLESETERIKFALDQKIQNHLSSDPVKILINDGTTDLNFTLGKKWLEDTEVVDADCASIVRIKTNKAGRRLHDRYITIVTASETNQFDNTDYKDDNYGDITYEMKDVNKQATLVGAEAKETWIIFEPLFDYEIFLGTVDIPLTLPGNNDDAWECHAVAAPTISKPLGCIELIANPRLKWKKGGIIGKSVLVPAELKYDATYHTNRILLIFKHPVGAQCEFQINLGMFK